MATTAETREENLKTFFNMFNRIEITFSNNDILLLVKKVGANFYGFKQGDVFELFYGQYGRSNDTCNTDKHSYMVSGAEYYPITDLETALNAFVDRAKSSAPYKPSELYPGKLLEECLEKDPGVSGLGENVLNLSGKQTL